jgi:hypothetical protein
MTKRAGKAPPAQSAGIRSNSGKYLKGKSGNPSGKPPGTRNRKTILAEKLTENDADALLQKMYRKAMRGSESAARLILDRMRPVRKAAGKFKLPDTISTLDEVDAALSSVASAQSAGKLLPDEVAAALATIEAKRVLILSRNLDPQLREIEKMISNLKGRSGS